MDLHMHHAIGYAKVIGTATVTQVTGVTLSDINIWASIFAYVCGGIASLAVAYYHLRRKK